MIPAFLLIVVALSFLIVLFLMPFWIRKAHQIGLVWQDMNKSSRPGVAGSGGMVVLGSFIVTLLFFVAYRVFYLQSDAHLVEILSLLLTVVLLGCIGLIDDLFGWQHGGLSRRSRIVLVLIASLPLVVINAGRSVIELPFLGALDLGLVYPLFLIPLAIVGTSTTFNFLAGFNALEGGQGVIILGALSAVAYFTGNSWLAVVGVIMIVALLGFLWFNVFPAQIFPGDCLTYPVGGMIAIMAILGNFEKVALFFFIPTIIEVVLKSRGRFIKQSFGKPLPDGSLALQYPRIYSLNHAAIVFLRKIGITSSERNVVFSIWAIQIAFVLIGFLLFKQGIFFS